MQPWTIIQPFSIQQRTTDITRQNLECRGVRVRSHFYDSMTFGCHLLFLGFSTKFWKAYHEIIPKAPGFEERHLIYTLYHYLNHYNLFGSGYYNQCQSILTTLTREVLEDV